MKVVELGAFIRNERLKKEVSSRKVGEALGLSSAYLSKLERGQFGEPNPDTIVKILEYLEVEDIPDHLVRFGVLKSTSATYKERRDQKEEYIEMISARLHSMDEEDLKDVLLMVNKYFVVLKDIAYLDKKYESRARIELIRDFIGYLRDRYQR
jgi:transcriptional regulator with XRE-family HTH domain